MNLSASVMRFAVDLNPENGEPAMQPEAYLKRAFAVADTLVKHGFISPTLEMLRNKFEIYAEVLNEAFEERWLEQRRQLSMVPSISAKRRIEMAEGLYHEDRRCGMILATL
jgi:hypothetical protein